MLRNKTYVKVKLSRVEPLGNSQCVEEHPGDVERGHEENEEDGALKCGAQVGDAAVGDVPVDGGDDAGQGKGGEDAGSHRAVLRLGEFVEEGDNQRGCTEHQCGDDVDDLRVKVTVKAVVETGHYRAGNQQ